MNPFRSIHKIVCDATDNTFPTCMFLKSQAVNIWQIPFKASSGMLLEDLHAKFSGEEWFVACYWICVLTAVVGLCEAVGDFIRIYSNNDYEPVTFWSRGYRNIPYEFQRKSRILGSSLNIALSVFLLFGFLNFLHLYSFPWIIVNALIIALESFFWISNLLRNKVFKWKPFMSVAFLLLRLLIVAHVSMVISEFTIY